MRPSRRLAAAVASSDATSISTASDVVEVLEVSATAVAVSAAADDDGAGVHGHRGRQQLGVERRWVRGDGFGAGGDEGGRGRSRAGRNGVAVLAAGRETDHQRDQQRRDDRDGPDPDQQRVDRSASSPGACRRVRASRRGSSPRTRRRARGVRRSARAPLRRRPDLGRRVERRMGERRTFDLHIDDVDAAARRHRDLGVQIVEHRRIDRRLACQRLRRIDDPVLAGTAGTTRHRRVPQPFDRTGHIGAVPAARGEGGERRRSSPVSSPRSRRRGSCPPGSCRHRSCRHRSSRQQRRVVPNVDRVVCSRGLRRWCSISSRGHSVPDVYSVRHQTATWLSSRRHGCHLPEMFIRRVAGPRPTPRLGGRVPESDVDRRIRSHASRVDEKPKRPAHVVRMPVVTGGEGGIRTHGSRRINA